MILDARTPAVELTWKWCNGCGRLRLRVHFYNWERDGKAPQCQRCMRLNARRRSRSLKYGTHRKVRPCRARAHLSMLSSLGVGRRAVQDITGINHRTLRLITSGKQRKVLLQNETAILAITADLLSDGAHIDSGPTLALVKKLNSMGVTKREIARCFGSKAKVPQFDVSPYKITARKAADVARLYRIITSVKTTQKRSATCSQSAPTTELSVSLGKFLFPLPKPANGRKRESAN